MPEKRLTGTMIIAEEYRKAVLDDLEKILNAQDDDWAEKIIQWA